MTLNEEVARALGWQGGRGGWLLPGSLRRYPTPDFEHDWNAVYRWIVPAVKEMKSGEDLEVFARTLMTGGGPMWFLYATPEDYCRAFLKVTK